ncbi:hypothetical protein CLAFUW4_01558 [Fulvia fulva]|uniref:DUF2470 domain-containing protein n=1 Tax=Passalora fulva TaxID=5499 RepID=A0A9Q8P3Z7_PASFU|nr:uncharacterized protein CLAFUR5_01558 [Fulvia fulva]KAK4635795.1 hypothetical protein CLAFUR4_01557 [Fulvia fulva]KAK4636924.1 hypothetical protein CLAFUR0_01558 [Fulvia fulva]UJO12448.1 hypothetical protein CLAFUR5_01558 [Fulvia fulva]WPV08414.1 hypothetical protein CLAFUW4_01558 [Fulvia fulva]WPV23710.1 hypothetical protein CLAFUW7_01561 [Fulvia fulva]
MISTRAAWQLQNIAQQPTKFSMADSDSQDAAARDRIISHMNKDHHDSISRYLQYWGKVSLLPAHDGRMTDITLSSMTLSCHGRDYRVPFEPAMTSYREARERVVELDKECRKALGHSDVTVKQYIPPNTPMYMTEIAIISATFLAYSQRWWFAAGGPVGHIWPAFARFSWAIQPWVIGLMVLIHGTEAVHFASSRLLHHSVNPRSRVFWLWAASFFIEGVFALRRFDEHVKTLRLKQKH